MGTRNREKETEMGRGMGSVKSKRGAQVTGPHSPITQRRSLRSQAGIWPLLAPSHPFCTATSN